MNSLRFASSYLSNGPSNMAYRPDIDGLRGIAVLLVVAYHYFGVRGGFVGVDIFFVISGYLITTILLRELSLNQFSLSNFYIRRIKRIFPALILVIASCLIFGGLVLLSNEYALLGKHVLAGTMFSSNIVFWLEAGYFDKASHLKPLLHLWSLGVEEQFYIFWPLILFWAYKQSWSFGRLISGLIVLSCLMCIYVSSISAVTAFYWLPTRAWQLLAGAGLAYIQLHGSPRYQLVNQELKKNALSILGLVIILFSASQLSAGNVYPGYWALIPTIGAVLVIFSGEQSWINKKILSRKWIVYVGLISYPLYLWHWPIISFARIMGNGEVARTTKIVCFLISLLLAYLTYVLVEKKIRQHKDSKIVIKLIALMIVMGIAGTSLMIFKGFPERYPEKEEIFRSLNAQSDEGLSSQFKLPCERSFLAQNHLGACQKSNSEKLPDAFLIGDSHAISSYPGLAYQYQQSQKTLMMVARGACVPLMGVETHRRGEPDVCKKIMDETYEYVLSSDSIRDVIVIFRGPWYLHGGGKSYNTKESNPIVLNDLSFEDAIIKTYQALESKNKRMILFVDVPELDFLPEECVNLRPLQLGVKKLNTSCTVPYSKAYEISREYRERVKKISHQLPKLVLFDTFNHFCFEGNCFAKKDGQMFYQDGNHLSQSGSIYLGEKFFEENRYLFKAK
jgi:peptidoglycan/LPS O-acetylase OafA/YrhL